MHPTLASVLVALRMHLHVARTMNVVRVFATPMPVAKCVQFRWMNLSVLPPAVVLIQVVATHASSIMLSVQIIQNVNKLNNLMGGVKDNVDWKLFCVLHRVCLK